MIEYLKSLDKVKIFNIFIVRTPFQLINSYEAKDYFKTENNLLVIIDNGTKNNKMQLSNLIYKGTWEKVIRFGENEKSNFFNYIKLIKKLRKLNINHLFIGSGFNKMQQILIANINTQKSCFIDAGTTTMETYNKFKKNDINLSALKKIRFKLFGLKTNIDKDIDFFTMFDLIDLNNSKIYKNNYKFMSKRFKSKGQETVTKEIYIIGQRFVSANILDESKYFDFLNIVIEQYKDYKINYLMHRTEDINYLNASGYNKKLNIVKSLMPGELFFLTLSSKPRYIIGTVSTLMISLRYIFSDINIISYQFNFNDFKKNIELYKLEYENMRNNGIKVKEIETKDLS